MAIDDHQNILLWRKELFWLSDITVPTSERPSAKGQSRSKSFLRFLEESMTPSDLFIHLALFTTANK
jgi:hypothetical protein